VKKVLTMKRITRNRIGPVRSAFTLIELLLVMVILVILASIVVPKMSGYSEKARLTKAKTEISSFDTALAAFEVDCGRYPSDQEGLQALVTQPQGADGWKPGGYMKSVPATDPWGKPYIYHFPGTHNTSEPDISSSGPDQQEGTADDITNWVSK
jgi:general secretion pathway protein G